LSDSRKPSSVARCVGFTRAWQKQAALVPLGSRPITKSNGVLRRQCPDGGRHLAASGGKSLETDPQNAGQAPHYSLPAESFFRLNLLPIGMAALR
jgi:hypothetical protein